MATPKRAIDLEVNFFDTADIYGYVENEKLLGEAIRNTSRDKLVIATKCGVTRDEDNPKYRGVSNEPEYIKLCCENSLKRMTSQTLLYNKRQNVLS